MSEGMPDISGLLAQAQQMQAQLAATQEQLALEKITGAAGGGLVRATVTGSGELVGLCDLTRSRRPGRHRDARRSRLGRLPRCLEPGGAAPERGHGPAHAGSWWPRAAGDVAVYEGIVQDLIDELGRLPGVGPKSAQRIAFHLLAAEPADVRRLAEVLQEVKAKVRFCRVCGNVAESDECRVCLDPRRDLTVICVVEEPKDVVAVERTREFRGRYHVLGGAISPIEGIGPDDLRVKELHDPPG